VHDPSRAPASPDIAGARRPPLRVVIDRVRPEVDGGRFAAKRVVGEDLVVEADILCDGHEELDCRLLARPAGAAGWIEVPMSDVGNDSWRAAVPLDRIGPWEFDVVARIDDYATWLRDLARRIAGQESIVAERGVGRELVVAAARSSPAAQGRLGGYLALFDSPDWPTTAADPRLVELVREAARGADEVTRLVAPRPVWVDRRRAAVGSWYEVFPRSWSGAAGRHGTLADLADRLPYVQRMGFDVLYLTPIHPIGRAHRKGRNNAVTAAEGDVGSPWAIGAAEGGHTAIHPALGDFADFSRLRHRAAALGLELALDLAIQCAPDHPWVTEHPEWFRHRPDGTIRYAENPPKKYQDIVPFDFGCTDWRALWQALLEVVRFWIGEGVRIFRVDNPHTKPFAFWEWLIAEVHRDHPDVLFLSEAFTRPKTMFRLAKLGFTWSYTYFTWRTAKEETGAYLEEVSTPPLSDFFRPAFWPNTPDILHATLQEGGRPMFEVRLALAALSVGTWGIYGPAMELLEARPRGPGSEEYLDSEKYEIRHRDLDTADSLAPFITRLNAIRRDEPALARNRPPLVQTIDDDSLLAWARHDPDSGNRVLVVVNLDPNTPRSGLLHLDPAALGLPPGSPIAVHDLLREGTDQWLAGAPVRIVCTPDRPVLVQRLVAHAPTEVPA
jgi:starch synthase (maltosyl-transferring)